MGFVFVNLLRQREGRTNIGTEAIDNNLPFLVSVAFFLEALISEPLINKTHEGIYTTQADSRFLIGKLLYSLGIAATTLCMNLADMVAFVLLRVLLILLDVGINFETVTLILPVGLQKSQNRNNTASNVQQVEA